MKAQQEADHKAIEELAGVRSASKDKKESVRVKKQTKSTAELELLVESLKRVVEKLKTENEALKRENSKTAGRDDKVVSEKALRQKIHNLEQHVQSLEMKEVNLEERDTTIKRLISANKQLREDLAREVDRFIILEDRYKDVVLKLETASKSNQKNEEMLFGLTTGGSMSKYQGFLSDNSRM